MNFSVFGTKRTVYYREVSSRRGASVCINSSPRWMLFQLIVTYESLSGRDCSCQRPRACPKTPNKRCEIIRNFISKLRAKVFNVLSVRGAMLQLFIKIQKVVIAIKLSST